MNLEFHEAELHGIGRATITGKGMAAKLHLAFMDSDDKLINRVNLEIFIPRSPALTLSDMQRAARTNAIALLKAATLALEGSDIATLEGESEAAVDDHIKRMFGGDEKTD
jgi:hypothetical protein